jgi:hypothetical protein
VIGRPVLILAASIFATFGCYHPPYVGMGPIANDSANGIISVTGTAFEQQIVLRSVVGVEVLSAHSADSAALSRMGGVEVSLLGLRTDNAFYVRSFTAVKVAGAPVVDGILRSEGDRLTLETVEGRMPLGNPPAQLKKLVGARVWIGGPLDTGPNNFGIIAPAP